ncbi:MAG: discoidin domain-containing protein [Chloroflexia bacterium]|nr:discoidin domain-containing protein [Chloroflexia bacterium]
MLHKRALTIVMTALMSAIAVTAPVFAAPGPGSAQPVPGAYAATSGYCADSEEQAFLGLLNGYRAQNGLAPVKLGQSVGAAAKHHSLSMGTYNYFDHFLVPEGISFGTNMINHGYSPYTWRGENLAGAYDTAPVVLQAWKNSASHNQNMLGANWLVVGIGRVYVAGSTYGWYWTADFGSGDDTAATLCSSAPAPVPTSTPRPLPTSTPVPQPTSTPVGGVNAAEAGTPLKIVRSGRTSGSSNSAYAYDQRATTWWSTTTSTAPRYAYAYFDLGAAMPVGSINWMFSQSGGADRLLIQVSNDRRSWTTVATVSNAAANTWQSLRYGGTTRYVRFYFENPNQTRTLGFLSEVNITK